MRRLEAESTYSLYHNNLGTQVIMARIRLKKNKKLLDSGYTWKVEPTGFFFYMEKKTNKNDFLMFGLSN